MTLASYNFRISMISHAFRAVCFSAIAALATVASAETNSEKPASAAPPAPKFSVWTSQGCSRTLRVVETYPDVRSALNAAERLRAEKETFAMVFDGEAAWDEAFAALNFTRSNEPSDSKLVCSVYRKACRVGWQNVTPKRIDLKSAAALVADKEQIPGVTAMVFHTAAR